MKVNSFFRVIFMASISFGLAEPARASEAVFNLSGNKTIAGDVNRRWPGIDLILTQHLNQA